MFAAKQQEASQLNRNPGYDWFNVLMEGGHLRKMCSFHLKEN